MKFEHVKFDFHGSSSDPASVHIALTIAQSLE